MPYITEGDKTYWLPDTYPEKTDEWDQAQRAKRYYIPSEQRCRSHPRWNFDNGALVTDEYLYKNGGWLRIVDNYPSCGFNQIVITDPFESWIKDESAMTATVTYTIWQYVYPEPTDVSYTEKWEWTPEEGNWVRDESAKTITATYTRTDLTADELTAKDAETWADTRYERNLRLAATDHILLQAQEKSKTVSDTVKTYRQALRDLPSNISNIRTFNITSDALWPTEPTSDQYFTS
tara:strand:- start:106 stop:810 length:705 start_codon:yes stop_codon:yes gene_type:complete